MTATILCILFNVNRSEKQPAKGPDEFNPMIRRKKPKQTAKQKVFAIGDAFGIPRPEAK